MRGRALPEPAWRTDFLDETSEWEEFPGVSRASRHFGGAANFDEIDFPTKGFSGLTLRLYDPEILHGRGPLEPGGSVHLDRLAEVSRHPAGCVEAHGRIADQRCQVRLKALELGGTDLPLPLIAQLVEDRFTGA